MSDVLQIQDFLEPVSLAEIAGDHEFKDGQIGKTVSIYDHSFPDIRSADIVILGCAEERGNDLVLDRTAAPFNIREQFYCLYNWHDNVRIVDIGNVSMGATLADSYAALRTVIREIIALGKTVVILGGGHDLTLAQYQAYAEQQKVIEATCIDALINIDINSIFRSQSFLMPISRSSSSSSAARRARRLPSCPGRTP